MLIKYVGVLKFDLFDVMLDLFIVVCCKVRLLIVNGIILKFCWICVYNGL